MPISFKKLIPHLVVLIVFVVAALVYFSPVLQGDVIYQSDIAQYTGMAKQQKDFKTTTGEETYWTNSAFGGMPTYQLGARYPNNFIKKLDLTLRFLPRPADYLFLYLISMYVLLLVLKIDYKLAFLGALAFGFSTYLIIILGVGHNAKAHAIAYMPLVLSGIILTFRGKYFYGFVLTAIAMGLELVANHFQMTYYLLLLVGCLGLAYLIDAYRKKKLKHFATAIGVLVVAVVFSIGFNATSILATQEYAAQSTRGKSELTINLDGSPKEASAGLDFDYITEYSYGRAETFNLLVPRFMGGGSGEPFPGNSKAADELKKLGVPPTDVGQILRQIPMYWGQQPIVEAPAYIGAAILILALLGLFLVKGRMRWWLVAGFVLSLLLSWGKNFEFLTQLFIEYVPLYDKFRAVSSIQVLLELIVPILAIVGLHQYFNDFAAKEAKKKALLYSTGILGLLLLAFIGIPGTLFEFTSPYDAQISEAFGEQGPYIMDSVRADRIAVLRADSIRSLLLILATAGVLYALLLKKLKEPIAIGILAAIVLFDLVGIDRRYVNNEDFVDARVMEQPFEQNGGDLQILKDDPDDYFRVYDLTTNPFSSGRASYFHNALGGYHGAKLGRVQDIDNFYLSQGNIGLLNMLNVRYILQYGENGGAYAQRNPYANGNAWFVDQVKIVADANQELLGLDSLSTKQVALVHSSFEQQLSQKKFVVDSTASIEVVNVAPNRIEYQSNNTNEGLVVFSEIYYAPGWKATIDGQEAKHLRANYLLRAMQVPAGEHTIAFNFDPPVVKKGSTWSLIAGLVFIVGIIVFGFLQFRKEKQETASS
ncbi:MAG: YfhO family protein [Gilvibacter sp.]